MKKNIVIAFFALFGFYLFAQNLSESEAFSLLQKTDSTTNFSGTDFNAYYSLVQEKPGQGTSLTEATMHRRDSNGRYTILVSKPASDKGKGYLQIDGTIWFYDPHDNQFTFTSSQNKFQNTNANNGDFAPMNFARDYKIESAVRVKLGTYNCVLFHLKATAKKVDYPEIKIWVTEEDGLIRKKEDYSLSSQLLRTTAIPSYQKTSSGRSVPYKMLIVDNLRGKKIDGKMQFEKTQITITNVNFEKQDDIVYTKTYLEMMGHQ
ncbi:MAG: outer membrane lipoprotein-sorting protein [Treponema sp.]|nr:outer membrane lipoprotein-sorting protein [Treponema sp.]